MDRRFKIITAKRAGFCFGVKRAVDLAFDAAKNNEDGVYTFGPIIHNPQVIEKLKEKGVQPTEDIENPEIKTIIIRTHGIPEDISQRLKKSELKVVDATCPFVKKAQQYAKLLKQEGYQVIIIGDRGHPEVKGLMSYAGKDAIVINKEDIMPRLKRKVGVIVQTTQPLDILKRFVSEAIGHVKELKVFNTICNSTALRLKETKEMARKVDVMIVVGGKNSANTTQLAQLCNSMSVPVYHIETDSEIEENWFSDARTIGITAGASTPDWIINDVEKRIRYIGERG